MSEPKRYGWEVNEENDFAIVEHPQGQYVDYEDYARLKAQVERLTKAGDAMLQAIKVPDPILDWKIGLWNDAKGVQS